MKESKMTIFTDSQIPQDGLAENYEMLKELGDCYVSVKKYDQAQQCYDRAAELDPDNAGPYVGIGTIAFQQGHLNEAQNAFKVAVRLDSGSAKAFCGLAAIYQLREQYDQAFDLYLRCLEIDTDNMTALLGLFQTSCQMGSFSKVIHYLEVYRKMHPKDTAVMFCLATLYIKDHQPFQARQTLYDILAIEPANTEAIDLLEEAEHMLGQTGKIGA